MTRQIIPNEELISALKAIAHKGVADYFDAAYPNSEKIVKAADLLQAQAERIKELETVPMKYRRMQFNAELQEENARLRAQLAELEKTEPVAWFDVGVNDTVGAIRYTVHQGAPLCSGDKLFTRPMPAQGVTELVEALEMIVSTHQGHCEHHVGVSKHSYNLAEIAEEALSKYKGAK